MYICKTTICSSQKHRNVSYTGVTRQGRMALTDVNAQNSLKCLKKQLKMAMVSTRTSAILEGKRLSCVFEPPFRNLGETYDDHLRLVGKRVGDFLLVLIKLFSLGRTAEALRAIIGSKSLQRGPVDPKFQIEEVASTHHSSSQKTRLNDLSHGMKIWTYFSSVLSQCTRLKDRRTDRNLIAKPRLHSMQRGNEEIAEKAAQHRRYKAC